jgi:hypothetical protein
MSRFAPSPLIDDRSTKRTKISTEAEMATVPENIAEIVADGDTILVLKGLSAVPDKAYIFPDIQKPPAFE